MLFNSVHFSKCMLKEEWDTILRKQVEYYDNDVSVHSVYTQIAFYGLCLIIKCILSYLILKEKTDKPTNFHRKTELCHWFCVV